MLPLKLFTWNVSFQLTPQIAANPPPTHQRRLRSSFSRVQVSRDHYRTALAATFVRCGWIAPEEKLLRVRGKKGPWQMFAWVRKNKNLIYLTRTNSCLGTDPVLFFSGALFRVSRPGKLQECGKLSNGFNSWASERTVPVLLTVRLVFFDSSWSSRISFSSHVIRWWKQVFLT